jgi:ribosomal-protein-alanine N-acetyltransferase
MLMPPDWRPPTLTTPRLVLRPFAEADVAPLFQHSRNPNVTRFTLWDYHKTEADTLAFVRDYALVRYREGLLDPYAITLTSNLTAPIGACGCFWASEPNKTMELGYWIAEPFWGQGLTVEACRAVVGHAFRQVQPERMQARVIAGNEASRRVLEKLRFRYEGTLRGARVLRGESLDVLMFAILRPEWVEEEAGT